MPQPTVSDVHIDVPLSTIATAYKNQDGSYIAEDVFPTVPVQKQSDKYYEWTKDFWFRNTVEQRSPGDDYPVAGMEVSSSNYYAELYHLAAAIADEERANQDPAIQLEQTKAEFLADQFLLQREIKFATDAFALNVWDTDVVGTTDFVKWGDYAGSNPMSDIDDGMKTVEELTGRTPNVLVLGVNVYRKLRRHPLLLDMHKFTSGGILSQEQVRSAFDVEKMVIARAIKNTAVEGATFAGARILGDNALLAYVTPTPGIRVPTAGYTFRWNIDAGGFGVPITNWRDEARDRNLIRGKTAYDHKIVGSDLGYFFSVAI